MQSKQICVALKICGNHFDVSALGSWRQNRNWTADLRVSPGIGLHQYSTVWFVLFFFQHFSSQEKKAVSKIRAKEMGFYINFATLRTLSVRRHGQGYWRCKRDATSWAIKAFWDLEIDRHPLGGWGRQPSSDASRSHRSCANSLWPQATTRMGCLLTAVHANNLFNQVDS